MSRDFKVFMSGFLIATFIFMIGMYRNAQHMSIEAQYRIMGGK